MSAVPATKETKRVALLMGGWSAERDVSLSTGAGCSAALKGAGYDVLEIDVTRDLKALLNLLDPRPDVVFNALHGRFGEDGCIQGLLDMLAIPYTHSGVLASSVAMHKAFARHMLANVGIAIAPGEVMTRKELLEREEPKRPYVIKPLNEGSSVGVHLVFEDDAPGLPFGPEDWPLSDEVLIETFIPGREIQVAVMGNKAIGAIEIQTERKFYDYHAKYEEGGSTHTMPAPIHAEAYREALEISVQAHRALGCRGVSRVDLRYDDTAGEPGKHYVLEVNTQPGMTPTSLVPEIAAHAGISFEELVSWMVENARCDA